MRGRKPKPERLRLIDGDVRIIGGAEPPEAPAWLDGDARAEWDRVVAELSRTFTITPLDALSVAAYCRTFSMWRQADENVRVNGLTFDTANGTVRINPAAKLCLACFEAMRRMGAEFGFSPASRSRLQCSRPAGEERDDFDTFLEAQ